MGGQTYEWMDMQYMCIDMQKLWFSNGFSNFYKSITNRRTNRRTDRWTNRRIDGPSYRDAIAASKKHLDIKIFRVMQKNWKGFLKNFKKNTKSYIKRFQEERRDEFREDKNYSVNNDDEVTKWRGNRILVRCCCLSRLPFAALETMFSFILMSVLLSGREWAGKRHK